jgi:lipoyl(octanoyl) transferase
MRESRLLIGDLGRMEYRQALDLQRRLQHEVIAARARGGGTMHLLLVEHEPAVITVSRRPTARQNLIAGAALLARHAIVVCETDRGGDITYHGPGQLVAYPILDLEALHLRLHDYMRLLEQVVIDTIARFGVAGRRDPRAPGVWVGEEPARKICAMGVRVARWVSMHGLALNVTTNLAHFDLIVPCGLAGRAVTSLERELGPACPAMDAVKTAIVDEFRAALFTPPAPRPP